MGATSLSLGFLMRNMETRMPTSQGVWGNPMGQGKQNTEHGPALSDCSIARSCASCCYCKAPLWVPCLTCKCPHFAVHATVHGTCSRQSTNSIPQGYCYQVAEAGAMNPFSEGVTEVQPDGAPPRHRLPGAPDLPAPSVDRARDPTGLYCCDTEGFPGRHLLPQAAPKNGVHGPTVPLY